MQEEIAVRMLPSRQRLPSQTVNLAWFCLLIATRMQSVCMYVSIVKPYCIWQVYSIVLFCAFFKIYCTCVSCCVKTVFVSLCNIGSNWFLSSEGFIVQFKKQLISLTRAGSYYHFYIPRKQDSRLYGKKKKKVIVKNPTIGTHIYHIMCKKTTMPL